MKDKPFLSVIIPTLNAASELPDLLTKLQEQQGVELEVIVIDSTSDDATQEIAREYGVRLHVIERLDFDHGGTRTIAASMAQSDLLIFMTQDALPESSRVLETLVLWFEKDSRIAAVYGRQLPNPDACACSEHLRLFNYPDISYVRCFEDRKTYGFKTAFISNSFAAYRKEPLEKIGYFQDGLLFGEDTYALANLLIRGYCVAYVAEACVFHSHNYSIWQDFKRYFDVGVFHTRNRVLVEEFGTPTGEGYRYVRSELSFLLRRKKYWLLPQSCLRNCAKFLAYNLGKRYTVIPKHFSRMLSMNRKWWVNSSR